MCDGEKCWQHSSSFFSAIKMVVQPVKGATKYVKPLLSTTHAEARSRVLSLYKAWYRHIPIMIIKSTLPITISAARQKLKAEFMKNKAVTDIRVIDMLVVKGEMELKEIVSGWKQRCHIMYMVKDTQLPRPKTFISKFLAGTDN